MRLPTLLPSLPIRRWLAVAFGLVFFVPVFLTAMIVFHLSDQPQGPWDRTWQELRDETARWSDPTWQEETRARLTADDIDVVLRVDGSEVFRTSPDPFSALDGTGQRVVQRYWLVVGGRLVQADVYVNEGRWTAAGDGRWMVPVVAVTSLIVTIAGSVWFLGRTVVRPLAAASDAARRVAAGDLDVVLPSSRVREVAQLNASFEAMSVELVASLRHQAELEQERRLFIGAIVHDLRTPLFSLRGYLDGLSQGVADTPEKRERYVEVATEKAAALEHLVADLFDFTRLEYLDQTPTREPLDLAALLRRLVEGIRPQAETKGIRLVLDGSSAPCNVDGDAHLLTRAIENLLDNAVRFTPSGGEVRLACSSAAGRAMFTVADTGPGIPPSDLPHLFTPLFRGETSRNRKTGGAGLGLTIARRIVLAHGGDLTASNAPTGGAIFRATLPAPARAELPTTTDAE